MVKTAAGDDMVPTPSNAMKNDIYICEGYIREFNSLGTHTVIL